MDVSRSMRPPPSASSRSRSVDQPLVVREREQLARGGLRLVRVERGEDAVALEVCR